MSFKVKFNPTKQEWKEAIANFKEVNFLQSWNWGEFHQALAKEVVRLLILDQEKIVGLAELVVEKAKRGNYLTVAGGPIIDWTNKALVKFIFEQIRLIAQARNLVFIRFRPQAVSSKELQALVSSVGAIPAQMHLTADLTLQLDLTLATEELLAKMRKNHRSAIRKAERLGIVVKQSTDPKDIALFYQNQVALAKKHGFVPFSYQFLYQQFRAFVKDNQVSLFHSYYQGELLASAFIIFYHQEAVYHYGISTPKNRKLPGSYACQWAAIKEAKKRGCRSYNFWGIAPIKAKHHRFAGVTLFKTGFGGQEVEYLHAQDIPLSARYYLVAIFEFIRRKLRML